MAKTQQTKSAGKRLIGTVIPVGALRSNKSIGVGEFPDLVEFAELCVKMGIGLIQILPVNDTGYESSPYSALTVFALHPLYLRIGDLPELQSGSPETLRKVEALGKEFEGEPRFPFEKILRAKMGLLREIYAANKEAVAEKAARGALGTWIEENPWIKEYAVYRRLKEANGEKSWQKWSAFRRITPAEIEALWNDGGLRREHLFWAWIQEALDSQFRKAAAAVAAKGVILEGDLPILINDDSCDVWAHPEYFHLELSAGAPPDMYSPEGQNWGFPIYNWETLAKTNYDWWRKRLATAEKYYQAYRIDHVLGFFRIWASPRKDFSAALGRFVPYIPITRDELSALGFDGGRVRWMSQPHIPTGEVWDALRTGWGGAYAEEDIAAEAEKVFAAVLDRIETEELWLFKESIQGEKDITALKLHPAAQNYLLEAWRNRLFFEYEDGKFSPTWRCRDSRAYASLSETEKSCLEELLEKHGAASEAVWEKQGKKLLSVLCESSAMLPCAEDLGEIPGCVPRVLKKLKILGLRVVRWHREWDMEGAPFVPFEDYPELSVCTPAVHDSSTLREWWDREVDQEGFCGFIGYPSLPRSCNPGVAKVLLQKMAAAASRFRVFQIQDLLHLSPQWYAEDPASERINVPGTISSFNWTYRLPAPVEEISKDADLIQAVAALAGVGRAKRKKK
ncbi:MAG: 4-alpha-glucanotransferase [Spirochaetaceae bacterium]|jgi:4-alpha-glucanotransferase|nr:4-alpha-glucanotransferase [Spirochaetaceae bacterium]